MSFDAMLSQYMNGMTYQTLLGRLTLFRAIESTFLFVETFEGIKAVQYLFLKIEEVLGSFELEWGEWQA